MTDAVEIQIADALVTALNAPTYEHQGAEVEYVETFVAARAFKPIGKVTDLAELRVTVIPRAMKLTPETVADNEAIYDVDIGVQKKIEGNTDAEQLAEIDRLCRLCEQLIEGAESFGQLQSEPPAAFHGATRQPLWDPVHLRDHGVFTAAITTTWLTIKPAI